MYIILFVSLATNTLFFLLLYVLIEDKPQIKKKILSLLGLLTRNNKKTKKKNKSCFSLYAIYSDVYVLKYIMLKNSADFINFDRKEFIGEKEEDFELKL